jgi:hypothetical protein
MLNKKQDKSVPACAETKARQHTARGPLLCSAADITSFHGVLVQSRVLLILAVCSIHHPRFLLLSLPSEASHGFSIQPSHVLGFTGHSLSSGGLAVRGVQLCETG